jgi:hypothetical protein
MSVSYKKRIQITIIYVRYFFIKYFLKYGQNLGKATFPSAWKISFNILFWYFVALHRFLRLESNCQKVTHLLKNDDREAK